MNGKYQYSSGANIRGKKLACITYVGLCRLGQWICRDEPAALLASALSLTLTSFSPSKTTAVVSTVWLAIAETPETKTRNPGDDRQSIELCEF